MKKLGVRSDEMGVFRTLTTVEVTSLRKNPNKFGFSLA